jgi:hypothetical protein
MQFPCSMFLIPTVQILDRWWVFFFSPNTNALMRAEICEALHIDTEALSDKYFGFPALVGVDINDCLSILLRG